MELAWRKSSRSGSNGCVEVAFYDGQIAVRDSKDRAGPVLQFTPWEWEVFLAGVRCGEFDAPVPLAQPSISWPATAGRLSAPRADLQAIAD